MNLADLRRCKRKPRVQRVRSMIVDDTKGHVYPMKLLYDFVQRSAMYKSTNRSDTSADDSDNIPVFDYIGTKSGDASPGGQAAEDNKRDGECSFVDYWEIDDVEGTYVYHHVMSRKRLFVPHVMRLLM